MSFRFRWRYCLYFVALFAVIVREHLARLITYTTFATHAGLCPTFATELKGKSIVFASILHDAEQVFPYWRTSTMTFVDCALRFGVKRVTVSVWSNGNTDSTTEELRTLARDLLGLHYGSDRLGYAIMDDGELPDDIAEAERITKLAYIRNLAIDQVSDAMSESDALIFVNDVIFSPSDAATLLADFFAPPSAVKRPMIVCALDFAYTFYDVWVARDAEGQRLSGFFPYISGPSEQRHRALAGESFEVAGCWNGLLVMDARIYAENRLRFRVARSPLSSGEVTSGECAPSSESLLICLDYWRTPQSAGRSVLINPGVKVYYDPLYFAIGKLTHPVLEWGLWLTAKIQDATSFGSYDEHTADLRENLVQMTCTKMPDWKLRHAIAVTAWMAAGLVAGIFATRRLWTRRFTYISLNKKCVKDIHET